MKSWSEIREVSWGVLAIFLVAIIAAAAFVNLVFLRTSNLFFAVGVYALANQPLTLVQSDLVTPLIMLLALGAAFFWRTNAPLAVRSASDAV